MSHEREPVVSLARKRRTKSGCLTCRKRRIKCDEIYDDTLKPVCRNCFKTRRDCQQAPVVFKGSGIAPTSDTKAPPEQHSREHPVAGHIEGDALKGEVIASTDAISVNYSKGFYRIPLGTSTMTRMVSAVYLNPLNNPCSKGPAQEYCSMLSEQLRYPELQAVQQSSLPSALSSIGLHNAHIYSANAMVPGGNLDSAMTLSQHQFIPKEAELATSVTSMSSNSNDRAHWSVTRAVSSSRFPTLPVDFNQSHFLVRLNHNDTKSSNGAEGWHAELQSTSDFGHEITSVVATIRENLLLGSHSISTTGARNAPRFTQRQAYYLQYFIQYVHLNFTVLDESFHPKTGKSLISDANFWSFVIPSMAVQSVPLLHAVLAIAALHKSNLDGSSEHAALLEYHQSIRELAIALQRPGSSQQEDLLAACLILAYFETMSGETARWGRHLLGAGDLVKNHITMHYSMKLHGQSHNLQTPTISDHLIWFFIHQDTIQCVLSGNGPFLSLEYIELCPLRGTRGSVTYASDQLRVLLARIGLFVSTDKLRKDCVSEDPVLTAQAIVQWEALLQNLLDWREQLPDSFSPTTEPANFTPCGPTVSYRHPAIASLQMMSLSALLSLHRAHPRLSSIPAEAIRATAPTTYRIGQDIIRMLGGVMRNEASVQGVQHGAHLRAMTGAVLPTFLASIAIGDPEQRIYVERKLQDIYAATGWRSAIKVLQGLDVAWKRNPRKYEYMPSIDHGINVHREGAGLRTSQKDYLALDKPEILGSAAGVLGRLTISSHAHIEPLPEYMDLQQRMTFEVQVEPKWAYLPYKL